MRRHPMDFSILIPALILVVFGLIMVFSATYYTGETRMGDGMYYFFHQMLGAIIGIGLMIGFSFVPYQFWKKIKFLIVVLAFLLLALVFVPGVGSNLNGSSRWIAVGPVSIQPSEVVKVAVIFFVAATCAANQKYIRTFRYGILAPCIIPLAFCAIIYFQPNFSAVVCIAILTIVMILVAGANGKIIGLVAGGGVGIGLVAMMSQGYRATRVATFLDPFSYSDAEGYQVVQSLYALGNGGFTGRGLGNSQEKLLYLPYGESDFIFSVIVEELGFLGAFALMACFAFLVYRIIRVAMKSEEMFGCLVATGVATIIAVQVIINIAVVTSSIPATGVSMPFISYGSSALIVFLAMIGVVLNISKQTKE